MVQPSRCARVCAIYLALIVTAVIAYKTDLHRDRRRGPVVRRLQRRRLRLHPEPVPVQPLLPPGARPAERQLEPTIAIVMPAFNEEDAVADVDPLAAGGRLSGARSSRSSSSTTAPPTARCARSSRWPPASPRVRVIDFPENRGKRAAMAAGIRATTRGGRRVRRLRQLARARRAARASCAASPTRAWARSPATPRCRTRASRGSRACRRCATSSRSASARRRSRSSARSRAARAASPPTGARRSRPVLERWENQRFLGRPGDLRRRPLADQLRAAQLEGHATTSWRGPRTIVPAHFRAVPAPAAALEALAGRASR